MPHIPASYDTEEPVQALSISGNQEFAALACRTHIRTCSLATSGLQSSHRYQLSSEGGANFIMTDVAWSVLDIERIAASANNGAIVVFNSNAKFNKSSKQEWADRESTYAVNRISWHNTDKLLISAHQNGEVKLWDIARQQQPCLQTYSAQANNFCKDAKFDPFHPHILAAIYENGSLHVWDRRKMDTVLHRISAHTDSATALAWSPTVEWMIATGSRDKTVKIWDLGSPNDEEVHHSHGPASNVVVLQRPINVIMTAGTVNRIAWRPNSDAQALPSPSYARTAARRNAHFHLATCIADKGDVSVWDASSASRIPACIARGLVEGCIGLEWMDTPQPTPFSETLLRNPSSIARGDGKKNSSFVSSASAGIAARFSLSSKEVSLIAMVLCYTYFTLDVPS
jgi:WD40 repeat protein